MRGDSAGEDDCKRIVKVVSPMEGDGPAVLSVGNKDSLLT